ncbi:alpha-amylase family glycosyl hydrolase [Arthrobacter sp. I2-34]|uniref:Alpha-amylase family glycosyl hydrolase n=1 Tax=Arthrobacter hankyongi TaxID=2904801 RepID=A0ABS9LCH0_9MICC|nr:alpha-amylase family glycosyl hydrolase [Arthrobacter hankyongi]MCG2624142.1 alpha-amylase family glycosyl hydrolase [Arthrobacter hankyongi]
MTTSVFGPEVDDAFRQSHTARQHSVAAAGGHRQIPVPFPSPQDWRDVWIYQILTDRFHNPQAQPRRNWDDTTEDFQGGTLNGVRDKLDYLQELGVGALWLSPVQMNCRYRRTYHGYGIQNFLQIDPRLASDPVAAQHDPGLAERELGELVDAAHARGLYVIFDVVLNHAGDVFEYVRDGNSGTSEAPFSDVPYPVRWRDENGQGRADWPDAAGATGASPAGLVWPHELQGNNYFRRQGLMKGEGDGDFASLKEFATERSEFLRNVLIRAHQYLIAKFDADGFRIDTLKFIEPEFARVFGNAIREYALSIGKQNFFTFGEIWDSEEKIAAYIGRNTASDSSDLIGVDAALDFPLFYALPWVAKGLQPPSALADLYAHRKEVQRGILSSHGDAGRFFVTFLDNHDQHQRLYFTGPGDPHRFDDQLTLAVGCLFALQGIPCLYYGTEQGLNGAGGVLEAVREALWGRPGAFDPGHAFYQSIRRLALVRRAQPALRYGRQYFRPVSGNGRDFGISEFAGGIVSFSRILNDTEIVVAANTNTSEAWTGHVLVDSTLNPAGSTFADLFTNKPAPGAPAQVAVSGGLASVPLRLQPMEIRLLARA